MWSTIKDHNILLYFKVLIIYLIDLCVDIGQYAAYVVLITLTIMGYIAER